MESTIVIPARLHGTLPAPTDAYRSAALLCMGALGGMVWQTGDITARPAFCAVLEQLGLRRQQREDATTWLCPSRARPSPLQLHADAFPEEAPLLALCLTRAQGASVLCGLERLSDDALRRLRAASTALRALGARVLEQEGSLLINGTRTLLGGATLDAGREPMLLPLLLAAASVCEKPVVLTNLCEASWPDWQREYALLGGCLRPEPLPTDAVRALAQKNVRVYAHLLRVADCLDDPLDAAEPDENMLLTAAERAVPAVSAAGAERLTRLIRLAHETGDSLGGIVEAVVLGLPAGLGAEREGRAEVALGSRVLALSGVKGVAFGTGFSATMQHGAQWDGAQRQNVEGGVYAGYTTGRPLIVRVAFRPSPPGAREFYACQAATAVPAVREALAQGLCELMQTQSE